MQRVIPVFLLCLFLLSAGCSHTTETGPDGGPVREAHLEVANRGKQVFTKQNNLTDKDVERLIQYSCRLNRLAPLANTKNRSRFELRLWINMGLPYDERLLRVEGFGSEYRAYFYRLVDTVDGGGGFDKRVLGDPESGWSAVRQGISSTIDGPKWLAPDPQFGISRHEGLICLELVENGEYRRVCYGHHSTFEDAARLKGLCGLLSGEFGLDIDCEGATTWLGPIE